MRPAQRLFDFLCGELSDLTGEAFIGARRYDLWVALASWGAHPAFNDDPGQLATALESGESRPLRELRRKIAFKAWKRLLERIRNFDPTHETPEEMLLRWGTPHDR